MSPVPEEGHSLSPKVTLVWRGGGTLRSLMVGLPVALLGLSMMLDEGPASAIGVVLLLAGMLVLLLGVSFALFFAGARYRRFRFAVDESRLWIRSGVLRHRLQVLPLSRIQHLDVNSGVVERAIGLAHLNVFTAGGRGASATIVGLEPERAAELRDRLLRLVAALSEDMPPSAVAVADTPVVDMAPTSVAAESHDAEPPTSPAVPNTSDPS